MAFALIRSSDRPFADTFGEVSEATLVILVITELVTELDAFFGL